MHAVVFGPRSAPARATLHDLSPLLNQPWCVPALRHVSSAVDQGCVGHPARLVGCVVELGYWDDPEGHGHVAPVTTPRRVYPLLWAMGTPAVYTVPCPEFLSEVDTAIVSLWRGGGARWRPW